MKDNDFYKRTENKTQKSHNIGNSPVFEITAIITCDTQIYRCAGDASGALCCEARTVNTFASAKEGRQKIDGAKHSSPSQKLRGPSEHGFRRCRLF